MHWHCSHHPSIISGCWLTCATVLKKVSGNVSSAMSELREESLGMSSTSLVLFSRFVGYKTMILLAVKMRWLWCTRPASAWKRAVMVPVVATGYRSGEQTEGIVRWLARTSPPQEGNIHQQLEAHGIGEYARTGLCCNKCHKLLVWDMQVFLANQFLLQMWKNLMWYAHQVMFKLMWILFKLILPWSTGAVSAQTSV